MVKGFDNQKGNSFAPGNGPSIDTDKSDVHVPSSNKYGNLNFGSSSPLSVEKAMASVCLITIGDGVWASGVLLNSQGLILTNAHLLEPWRFGKTHISGGGYRTNPEKFPLFLEGTTSLGSRVESNQISQPLPSKMPNHYPTYDNHRNIRVRLDHIKPWVWCDAKVVFVCKGPWDVALLQLEPVPDKLFPIVTNFSRPSTGSKAYVIGHGQFGPKCGFFPSVSTGVVAKVVEAKAPQSSSHSVQPEHMHTQGHFPAMLETTAAVHPGASGGAVINSDGHMIGLVTSNARHGGGTVIPRLNFSIPSSALAPIFKFAKDMQDLSLLRILAQSQGITTFCMSAVKREGTHEVICAAYELLRKSKEDKEGYKDGRDIVDLNHVARAVQKQRSASIGEFEILHESGSNVWRVVGSGLERFIQMTNWRYVDSEKRFQHVLEACGVFKSLVKLGVKEGDTVIVGEMEMLWHDSAGNLGASRMKKMSKDSIKWPAWK